MFLKHKTKPYQEHYANERPRSNFLCWETTYNIREKWGRTKFAVRRQWGVPWGQSDIIEASALLPWPSLHYRTGKSTMLLEWCKKENVTKVAKTMHYSNNAWRHVLKKWVEFLIKKPFPHFGVELFKTSFSKLRLVKIKRKQKMKMTSSSRAHVYDKRR